MNDFFKRNAIMKRTAFLFSFLAVFLGLAYGQSLTLSGAGTGFFISDDGIIVTCDHVIDGAEKVTVRINGREYEARILARNSNTDSAVLKINYQNPYHFKF